MNLNVGWLISNGLEQFRRVCILVVRHLWTDSVLVVLFSHETFMLISAKA